jgi:hypothetical protein
MTKKRSALAFQKAAKSVITIVQTPPRQEHDEQDQEPSSDTQVVTQEQSLSVKDMLENLLPKITALLVFYIVILTTLVVATVHALKTGDISLFYLIIIYVGDNINVKPVDLPLLLSKAKS